jgi:integrase
MALEIQRGRSKWWYARVVVNGRKVSKNLGVEIRGQVPVSLAEVGDMAFERSRAKAQAALERLQGELKRKSTAEELVQTIHELRTGSRVISIPLKEAGARWKALPRRRPLSPRYLTQALGWMDRFVAFVAGAHPTVVDMDQVQSPIARAFMKAEEDRGVSGKTYNNVLIFLRSAFESLKDDAGIAKNPFVSIPTREEDTVFRKPFSAEELTAIITAATQDKFIYPIIVTAMCTAMRRGDCCTLPWSAVDLPNRFIKVKTSKTGELVQIPIFPLLREVLEKLDPTDGPFVFPQQEMTYQLNPDNITLRVRKVLRAAGFFNPKDDDSDEEKPTSRGAIHEERKNGLRKASLRDFHSFRVTWVTLALNAGVPLELVQKVTGHRTAGIVMKHYFQPGREDFRRTLTGKLPSVIAGGRDKKPLDTAELRAFLRRMKPKTWARIRDELLTRLPAEAEPVVEIKAAPSRPNHDVPLVAERR